MWRIIHFSSNVLFCIATIGFVLSLPSFTTMVSSIIPSSGFVTVGVFKNNNSRDLGYENSDNLYQLLQENDRETAEKFAGDSKSSYVLRVGTEDSLTDETLYGIYSVYVYKDRVDIVEDAPEDTLRHWIRLSGSDMKEFKHLVTNPETKLIDMSFL